jgi:hypothetical protein
MKTKLLVISAFTTLSALTSCGDSGATGSGVAGDTLVKDVTESETVEVCKWNYKQIVAAYDSVSLRQSCTFEVASETSTKTECKEAVDDCVQDAEGDDDEPEENCDDLEAPSVAAGCNAITVSDYEACVKALLNSAKKLANDASCDHPGDEPDAEEAAEDVPNDCKVILTKCPSILPGELQPDYDVPGNDDLAE